MWRVDFFKSTAQETLSEVPKSVGVGVEGWKRMVDEEDETSLLDLNGEGSNMIYYGEGGTKLTCDNHALKSIPNTIFYQMNNKKTNDLRGMRWCKIFPQPHALVPF